MYPPREPNVRMNTDQFSERDFGMLPQSKASISFKSSRKPLADSAHHSTASKPHSTGSQSSPEPIPRFTGTLTTASDTIQSEDSEDSNSRPVRRP